MTKTESTTTYLRQLDGYARLSPAARELGAAAINAAAFGAAPVATPAALQFFSVEALREALPAVYDGLEGVSLDEYRRLLPAWSELRALVREPLSWEDLGTSVGQWEWLTEASTLGLRPGELPRTIAVRPNVGNGLDLYVSRVLEHETVYVQTGGIVRLRVAND